MKQQTIQVTCQFSDQEEIRNILLHSFRLYLHRAVTEQNKYASS